jgi:hypothetical protein
MLDSGKPALRSLAGLRNCPHPGAQLSLFDTIEGLRHTVFITDTEDDDLGHHPGS